MIMLKICKVENHWFTASPWNVFHPQAARVCVSHNIRSGLSYTDHTPRHGVFLYLNRTIAFFCSVLVRFSV